MKSPSFRRPIPARTSTVTVPSTPGAPPGVGIWLGLRLLLLLLLLFGTAAPAADQFVLLSTLPTTTSDSFTPALGDYDRDGDLDIAVANGAFTTTGTIDLFRNRGDGTFERMTASQAGDMVTERKASMFIQWTDVDNDGWLDLVGSRPSSDPAPESTRRVFRNLGDGSFRSVPAGDWGNSFYGNRGWQVPALDLNGDGWIDLLAGRGLAPPSHEVFFNRGDGTLVRRIEEPFLSNSTSPNSGSWADVDNDGDIDLFAATMVGEGLSRLYLNDGRGHFTIDTRSPLLQIDAGRGVWGDYDQDGDFDCIMAVDVTRLLRNDGGTFVEAEISPVDSAGFTLPIWFDFDNDARLDLLLTRAGDGSATTNSLLRNPGNGNFEEVSEPFTRTPMQRGSTVWGDIDNDGALDLVEAVYPSGGIRIYRNLGNANHWLKFRLQGTASSTDAIGALVRVRAVVGGKTVQQMQHVGGGNEIASDLRPNFGLGDATVAEEVRIQWPSGNVTVLTNVAANQILDVKEVVNIEPAQPVTRIGGSLTLTHTLAGATSRQWYFEAGPLAGATGAQLALTHVQPSQVGRYTVVAQTAAGAQTNHVYLTVLGPTLAATRVAEGLRLECRGDPATTYAIENSALVTGSWAKQQTVTTDAAGVATATVAVDVGTRFFRLVKQ